MSQDNAVTTLEQELEAAPKYGRNAAWILLKALAEEDSGQQHEGQTANHAASSGTGTVKGVAQPRPTGFVKVDMALFEAMPKVLRPNIDVNRRAKISRGPRITWLNRSIAIYLKFIGCDVLKLKPGAALVQEIKFNAALCRCAISAAQQHEADEFATSANANRYHAAMMRKHPSLQFLPAERLAELCRRYGQPCPELPTSTPKGDKAEAVPAAPVKGADENEGRCLADDVTDAAECIREGRGSVSAEADAAVSRDQGHSSAPEATAADPDGVDDPPGPGMDRDGGAAAHTMGKGEEVDDLFKELFGDDEGEGELCSPKGDDAGSMCTDGHDAAIMIRDRQEGTGEQAQDPGVMPGEGKDEKAAPEKDVQDTADVQDGQKRSQACESHPDDEFQDFLRDRKRAKRQHADRNAAPAGDSGGPGSVATVSAAAVKIRLDVQKYVGELLEPWLKGGSISVRQFTDLLGRVVEKVMSAHAGAGDSGFLESHASSIRKLVDRYVKFSMTS